MSYSKLARFYDPVIGDRRDAGAFLCEIIEHDHPSARSDLEIACGTGAVLGLLSESYEVTGLDRSRNMLAIARRKLPHVKLHRQDMTSFSIDARFDALLCVFDSINHLTRFSQWQQVFRRVKSHLNDGGLFIFDVNTPGRLRRLSHSPPWTTAFGKNWEIITVSAGRGAIFEWHIRVLEHRRHNDYRLHTETIPELAVPMKQIVASLKPLFRSVRVIDPEGRRPSDRSERLYFVCKK